LAASSCGSFFNAHCDDYGFQRMVVFDGTGRFVAAMLRPAKRPSGKEARAFLRRLLRAIRANWPGTVLNFVCGLGTMGRKERSHGPTQGTQDPGCYS
jgi:hypothetical protein